MRLSRLSWLLGFGLLAGCGSSGNACVELAERACEVGEAMTRRAGGDLEVFRAQCEEQKKSAAGADAARQAKCAEDLSALRKSGEAQPPGEAPKVISPQAPAASAPASAEAPAPPAPEPSKTGEPTSAPN